MYTDGRLREIRRLRAKARAGSYPDPDPESDGAHFDALNEQPRNVVARLEKD